MPVIGTFQEAVEKLISLKIILGNITRAMKGTQLQRTSLECLECPKLLFTALRLFV
jgi:hypothetical protein